MNKFDRFLYWFIKEAREDRAFMTFVTVMFVIVLFFVAVVEILYLGGFYACLMFIGGLLLIYWGVQILIFCSDDGE